MIYWIWYFYSLFCRPWNWSIEQLKPKAWLSLMKAGSVITACGRLVWSLSVVSVYSSLTFKAIRRNDHQGSRRTSLSLKTAWTTWSATKGGSRIGISLLCNNRELLLHNPASAYLNPCKHSRGNVVRANHGGFDVFRVALSRNGEMLRVGAPDKKCSLLTWTKSSTRSDSSRPTAANFEAQ